MINTIGIIKQAKTKYFKISQKQIDVQKSKYDIKNLIVRRKQGGNC